MFVIKTVRFIAALDDEMCERSHGRGHEIYHNNSYREDMLSPSASAETELSKVSTELHLRAGLDSKTDMHK